MISRVLDTSVFLHAGKTALYSYPDCRVVIPLGVVKQLGEITDREFGWVASQVLREIERIRLTADEPHPGVFSLSSNASVTVEMNHTDTKALPNSARTGNGTVAVAYNLSLGEDTHVILVTNSLTQKLIASSLELDVESYWSCGPQGHYDGLSTLPLSTSQMSRLYQDGELKSSDLGEKLDTPSWHGFIGRDYGAASSSCLMVQTPHGGLMTVNELAKREGPRGVAPLVTGKNAEQRIAQAHLMNSDLDIVSLGGPAGTGKTLLALAEGVAQVLDKGSPIKQVVVFRPLQEVGGQELGFLPGTEEEKMEPWAQAVKDALSVFRSRTEIQHMFARGEIVVEPATFIRGRTINNAFIIIDEAQNFERLTLLSVLSRLGQNSKAVLSWDAAQRDNLFIGKSDGVVEVVDRFKHEDLFAHITMTQSVRSRAAAVATRILDSFLE